MREANEHGRAYAHSPLDNLHSFFWTTVWAVMYNKNQIPNDSEALWRHKLRGPWGIRATVMKSYSLCTDMDSSYSPMVVSMQSFLEEWEFKVDRLLKEGHAKARTLSKSAGTTGDDILDMYKHLTFRGVAEYFELVLEYRQSLGSPGAFE